MNWRSLNGKYYEGPIEEILEEAIQREYNLGNQLKICVGTDSQVYKDKIEYATVVVVLREGRGGFYVHQIRQGIWIYLHQRTHAYRG